MTSEMKKPFANLAEEIQSALDYSRNFATAKPNIGNTEKEHILGLCSLLERLHADRDQYFRMFHWATHDLASVGEALGIPGEEQEGGAGEFIEAIEQLRAVKQQDALVTVQVGFSAAVADADRAAIEVFRDSCDHTRKEIEYMAAHLLAAEPTSATTA